jgi:lipopolysaccharide export system permease protein
MPNLRAVRTLDRYLVREVLVPTMYCFDAFAMMWVVFDMFDNLPDFIEYKAGIGTVFWYYFVTLPNMIVNILPVSLLLGLLWCLANMSRANEITAIRASGISIVRTSIPLLVIGLVATLIVFAVNEAFVPRSKERGDQIIDQLKGKPTGQVVRNFFHINPSQNRYWYAAQYDAQSFEMENPEVSELNDNGDETRVIYAERAHWHDNTWFFYGAKIVSRQQTPHEIVTVARTNFPSLREKPGQFQVVTRAPDQLYTRELRRYIRMLERAGRTSGLDQYRVEYHARYAFPWVCMLVVIIGVPLGMQTKKSGPMASIGSALLLVGSYYILTYISHAFGSTGVIPPVVAAWLSVTALIGIGAFLFHRAR